MRLRVLIAALALAAGAAGCGGGSDDKPSSDTATKVEVVEAQGGGDGGLDSAAIYEAESPGVVTVVSLFGSGGLDAILGQGGGEEGGVGSGFVLNDKGEIATNAHVVTSGEGASIRKASQVFVRFGDRNQVSAKVLGIDRFGNVELNLREQHLVALGITDAITTGPFTLRRARAFAEVEAGALAFLVDSSGWVALVANGGSAAVALGLGPGDSVMLGPPRSSGDG